MPLAGFVWQKHGFGSRHATPTADVTLRQIHSDRVVRAEGLRDRQEEGDALVTNQPGLVIGIRTADCVPILLLDPKTRAVAAIHAGWRGTASGIVVRTIDKLQAEYASAPRDLFATIGPAIRPCCYEVSADVADRFRTQFPEWGARKNDGKQMLDLPEANRRQLVAAGLSPDQLFDSGLCTHCLPDQLFSYRREPENPSRMLAVISRIA